MIDKELQGWATEFRKTLLDETKRLIGQAKYDLWFGPSGGGLDDADPCDDCGGVGAWDGKTCDTCKGSGELGVYPGFEIACERICEALEDVPSVLFFDVQCGGWSEKEPSPDECQACSGTGFFDGDEDECIDCRGEGSFEPDWEAYVKIERPQLIVALVGKELAEYVR